MESMHRPFHDRSSPYELLPFLTRDHPYEWKGSEWSRPPTKEGITQTKQAVEGIKRIGVELTPLLCSPLTRTQQTATIAKNILAI